MRVRSTLSAYGYGVRLAREMARLVYRPCSLESAKALIRRRLAARNALFLQMVHDTICQNPTSPYYHLMRWAGWTYDDLVDSVRERGLEATLMALRDSGVYLSHEEFEGGKIIQRNGLTLQWGVQSGEVTSTNPQVLPSFDTRTGGTRSGGSRVPASFTYLAAQRVPTWCVTLAALGSASGPVIVWMPREAGFLWWVALAHMHRPPLRWFSMTDLSAVRVPRWHQTMYRLGQVIGMSRGLRIPYLEYVPLSEASVVLDAVWAIRARHGCCTVVTSPSAATRLAGLASQRNADLERVAFLVGGEPLTPGKHGEIIRTGARVGVRYNITEAGAIGGACSYPTEVDDVHFLADSFALITSERALPNGRFVGGFMITALLPVSPVLVLNVDSDDFGQITVRRCGCVWDELGLHTHLSGIRSFSKLTGEGMTVLGTECVRIIEEVLPREFGGRSLDYQLLEVEDEHYLTRLCLVVSPSVGPIDEEKLLTRFQEELRRPWIQGAAMPTMWRQAGTIKVVRREPVATPSGKLLPFHTMALAPRQQGALGRS